MNFFKQNRATNKKNRESVFFLFVIGAFLFWILINLSKSYTKVITCTLDYINIPVKKIFQENPNEFIDVKVNASGFRLISAYIAKPRVELSLIGLKKKKRFEFYVLGDKVKNQFDSDLQPSIQALQVMQDTLFFKLGNKMFKKVPVVHQTDISYNIAYRSFEGVNIQPDSIEVSGPELQVKQVEKILLEPLELNNVQENISRKLNVIRPQFSDVILDYNQVNFNVKVEKITEKTIEIPITIINQPKGIEVVIYPKKVKVLFQVKLAEFNNVNASDFAVICDYQKRDDKFLRLNLERSSSLVSSVKLAKDKVEYLILK